MYSDVQALRTALETLLTAVAARKVEADRDLLRSALEKPSAWALINDFVQKTATFKVNADVRAINGIQDITLKRIEPPFPPERKENETIDFSFDINVGLRVSVLKWITTSQSESAEPEVPALRIGERNPMASASTGISTSYTPQKINITPSSWAMEQVEAEEIQNVTLRIQASANYSGTAYKDITLKSFGPVRTESPINILSTEWSDKFFTYNVNPRLINIATFDPMEHHDPRFKEK